MKKLIVLLLAFAMVGAVSAQVTTAVSLSGSVYLWNQQSAAAATGSVSPNGASYDVLTIKGTGKDSKFGFELIDYDLLKTPAVVVDYWDVWYNVGFAKATLGNLNGGNYVQYLVNGWLGNYGPTDNISGAGFLVENSTLAKGLSVGAFIPLTAAAATNAQKMVVGASYAATGLNVCGQVNMNFATPDTVANVGFDYTGVKGLDVYGFADYGFNSGDFTYGVGGQYKAATWRAGAEFEGTGAAWDAIANIRYYINPSLFLQIRPEYRSTSRMRVRGYVNYAFGNGFSAEGMLGYDSNPNATTPFTGLIDYVKFGYSVAF